MANRLDQRCLKPVPVNVLHDGVLHFSLLACHSLSYVFGLLPTLALCKLIHDLESADWLGPEDLELL
jgi:hypothetical protein